LQEIRVETLVRLAERLCLRFILGNGENNRVYYVEKWGFKSRRWKEKKC